MTSARPILIVEDNSAQRVIVADGAGFGSEFAITIASTLSEADARLNEADARFDAVILDLGVSGSDGHSYCAKLRSDGHKMPIIIVTSADEEADVVRALNAGANDYLSKPFRMAELVARLQAQLRVFDNSEDAVFMIGRYAFRPAEKLLLDAANKRRLRLTAKETAILKFLYRAGEPVARPILMDRVWGYNSGITSHTLETHIYRLRQKIETDPSASRLLLTEAGGYRLNAAAI